MSGGMGLWLAFALFLIVLVAGFVAAALALVASRDGARRARGEEPPTSVLGLRRRWPRRGVLALVLMAVGSAGSLGTGIAAASHGGMMGRGMMMGAGTGGGMMGAPRGGQAPPPVAGAPTVTVAATEFGFEPGHLRLRAGETVNLALENLGGAFHTFTISALDFELRVEGGTTATGALTPRAPGTFVYLCAVPGHEQAGMRGTVVVE